MFWLRPQGNQCQGTRGPTPPPATLMCFDFDGILAGGGAVREVMRSIPTEMFFGEDHNFGNYFEDPKSEKGENEVKLDRAIDSLTLVDGMRELIETMHKRGAKLIVMSANPEIVVERFLANKGLRRYFTKIYSHKAKFNSRDVLQMNPFVAAGAEHPASFDYLEMRTDHYLEEARTKGRTVALMGDGKNIPDIIRCALRKRDLACVRNGSGLHEYFRTHVEEQTSVSATFFRWTSGLEILLELEERGFNSCYELRSLRLI
jgi:hypothetical protein